MQAIEAVRVDPVLAVALAALAGGVGVVRPAVLATALVGAAALVGRAQGWAVALVLCVACAAGAGRAALTVGRYEAARIEARDALGPAARCGGIAEVLESPVWAHGALTLVVELSELECEERRLPGRFRVRLHGGPADVGRGDRLEVVAQLAPVQLFRNLDLPDPTPRAARRGIVGSGAVLGASVVGRGGGLLAWIDRGRAHARRRILETFVPAAQPMARALVLGESDLEPAEDEAFRRSGLSHMLAVSGTHLVFAVVSVVRGIAALLARIERFAWARDPSRWAAAAGVPLALAYADFAGGSGSAWRAAWMLAAAFLVRALGRRPRVARSVAVSVLIGVVVDPLAAFDVSFLLSAAATGGLVVLGAPLARLAERVPVAPLRWAAASTAATLASMTACAPLLLLLSPELSLAGIVANVLAAPFGETAALPLCLLHAVASPVPVVERGLALVASGALLVVREIALASAAARWAQVALPPPTAWQLAVASVCALAAVGARGRWRWACLGALALAWAGLELGARHAGRPMGELRVTVLDVGQGDSALVDLPDGSLFLIDGGGFVGSPVDPGQSVILPVLRARRRDRVDVAVLTHPHPDHLNGLASALGRLEVGELWDSGQGEAEGAGPTYRALLADLRRRGVPVRRPGELCGRPRSYGGANLRVLGPCPAFVPGRDGNDNSVVLHVAYGARAVLLTGDAEVEQERELLAAHGDSLRADLLKIGHHGSRTSSSPALLDRVRPAVATLSCGIRNRFGHPHPTTLAALAARGIGAIRVDRFGGARFVTDGVGVEVVTFSSGR
ncbi:MAG: DNA internalization-related competence protein ComEC/Rec2 [Polyangiaceae bacterium]|nr:DNA internalization-related competence protein ComEC/Rec2 [Polyangiaceae bacterium]